VTRVEHRLDPLLVALGRADLWSVSLAGFLVRGGVVLFLLPIAALPSPLDVANVFGPAVTAAALGGPNPELTRLVVLASVVGVAVVVLAFALGAATDVASIRAGAEGLQASHEPAGRGIVGRAFIVRLVALVPFGLALAATMPAVIGATYHELIDPEELVTPLVVRVLRDVPNVVVLLLVTWIAGEAIGGLAVRLAVLERRGVVRSIVGALAVVVRRPLGALGVLASSTILLVVLVAPALVATALAWRWVAFSLRSPDDIAGPLIGALALAALWLGGLALAGFGAAARGVLWTAFVLRR
jgi:hypothetical protein